MKTFKFSLVHRTRENTDVFITLDDNIYGIHSQRLNILYFPSCSKLWLCIFNYYQFVCLKLLDEWQTVWRLIWL